MSGQQRDRLRSNVAEQFVRLQLELRLKDPDVIVLDINATMTRTFPDYDLLGFRGMTPVVAIQIKSQCRGTDMPDSVGGP